MTIYTIGHSSHSLEHFLGLIAVNEVTAIVDVRSYPYSRRNPQFNRPVLKRALAERRVQYLFLGRELGARCDDKSCYERGRVVYGRLAARAEFKGALDRVLKGAEQYRIALMCAEHDPITCHRTILVARELAARGASIAHIRSDGSVEAHDTAMDRLMETLRLPKDDLYVSRSQLLERAYEQQEARIAYVDPTDESNESDIAWA